MFNLIWNIKVSEDSNGERVDIISYIAKVDLACVPFLKIRSKIDPRVNIRKLEEGDSILKRSEEKFLLREEGTGGKR